MYFTNAHSKTHMIVMSHPCHPSEPAKMPAIENNKYASPFDAADDLMVARNGLPVDLPLPRLKLAPLDGESKRIATDVTRKGKVLLKPAPLRVLTRSCA